MDPTVKIPLVGLDAESTGSSVSGLGLKGYQVAEMLKWIYARRNLDPSSWSNIPNSARAAMADLFEPGLPRVLGEQLSSDGTRKFLLGLADGKRIESVYIPDGPRRTICLSSQVGCAIGCPFCMTGRMGLSRNLTSGEILGQVLLLERETDIRDAHYNIVFMGMGEPLANLRNLMKALLVIQDPDLMAISRKRITVSTAGLADAIEELAQSPLCPHVAISMGSANDELRDTLIPANKKFPLKRLRATIQKLSRRDREKISLEYTLLGGVNDSEEDARALARFAKGLKIKVNLIPFNEVRKLLYSSPKQGVAVRFQRVLLDAGLTASVRRSKGSEILAACGQLALEGWDKN